MGCSEEEAEEFFSTAFEKVMESVNPIAREFSAPQMVNFIKRACRNCLIDERRSSGLHPQVELEALPSLSDESAERPEDAAVDREAVAIGREAMQMLPERDQAIFRQRHQMDLSPEEIMKNFPGLSLRTYRKLIQRANTRALAAFERIEGGERCEEMEAGLLHRYVTEESPRAERHAVEAHLAHCRACQKAQARMRGYLLDVASGLVAASTLASSHHLDILGRVGARMGEIGSEPAHALAGAGRALRERGRDVLLRAFGALPGVGGDATVGQVLTASSFKIASACAAGVAAGACVAAGVVPGIGAVGLLSQHDHPPAKHAAREIPAPKRSSFVDRLPSPEPEMPTAQQAKSGAQKQAASVAHHASEHSASAGSAPSVPNSASSARESDSVTSTEFGAESGQPAPASEPTPPANSPSGSPSAGGAAQSPGGGAVHDGSGSSSEFGL
jgi:RNA polymerase sigma factor (sigma-70 family)